MIWLDHVIVFTSTLVVDVFWARYNMATADRKAVAAGLWSVAICLGGTLSLRVWMDNHSTVISSAIGAFIGTYYAVKYGKKD